MSASPHSNHGAGRAASNSSNSADAAACSARSPVRRPAAPCRSYANYIWTRSSPGSFAHRTA